jgi:hypothetical protein
MAEHWRVIRLLWIGALAATIALPAAAASFRAINLLYVRPIDAVTFEVLESRGAGAADIWCAAADYARRAGLDGVRKRMYVTEPRGASRTTANAIGVVFTTEPDDALRDTPSSYSVTVTRRGENLGIGHAYDFCQDARFDRLNLF